VKLDLAATLASRTGRRILQLSALAAAVVSVAMASLDSTVYVAVAVALAFFVALVGLKVALVALAASRPSPPSEGVGEAGESGGADIDAAAVRCNICGGSEFEDYNGRQNARCIGCDSFERHRVCHEVYQREGIFAETAFSRRVMHFAPERVLFDVLSQAPRLKYETADINPKRYPYAEPLRLELTAGLQQFPDETFDYLIHNHVWEHIPGNWRDHIDPFRRVLKIGGKMIFTFPFPKVNRPAETQEGGELLPSDEDRLRVYGQHDHVRRFGTDFLTHMAQVEGVSLRQDGLSEDEKAAIGGSVRGVGEVVFIMDRLS